MAWVRIHDGALSHPKVVGIFDPRRPLDLWIWGLSYTQTHLTDGLLPAEALPHGASRAAAILVLRGLWEALETGGHQIHDYLDWNDSRETVKQKRADAKERANKSRTRSRERAPHVLSGVVLRTSFPEKIDPTFRGTLQPDDIAERADRLVERYGELYTLHRHGAKHRARPNLDWSDACTLVPLWDDARLEKLAVIVLQTDDEWIAKTDRSFHIFALKAAWADDRL